MIITVNCPECRRVIDIETNNGIGSCPYCKARYQIDLGRLPEVHWIGQHQSAFVGELTDLLNRHSRENGSDTADLILAQYLNDCLEAFDKATKARTKWSEE